MRFIPLYPGFKKWLKRTEQAPGQCRADESALSLQTACVLKRNPGDGGATEAKNDYLCSREKE